MALYVVCTTNSCEFKAFGYLTNKSLPKDTHLNGKYILLSVPFKIRHIYQVYPLTQPNLL